MKPFKPPQAHATNWLIGLCIAVHGAVLLGGGAFGGRVTMALGLVPARIGAALAGQADALGAGLTLVTHMFIHAGLLHLGLNLLFLAWVGRYVEWVSGWRRFVGLYLAGGLAGGLMQYLSDPGSSDPVVGASGAIAAVFGAYAVIFAQHQLRARRLFGLSISAELLSSLWLAATWIGLQLLTGLVMGAAGGALGGIAIWTHIGGFLTGLLVANIWRRGSRI